uniref:RING-type domain-containing protein n=1 Tax=Kalanchoe fedtschenkoi TaxID=63787 RepID=A0A7N1A308_KALFE
MVVSGMQSVYSCRVFVSLQCRGSKPDHDQPRTDAARVLEPPHPHLVGLSCHELDRLPRIRGRELGLALDCSICLRSIGQDDTARLLPGCNHGFHSGCIDAWLSRRPLCPLCRSDVRLGWVNEASSDEDEYPI